MRFFISLVCLITIACISCKSSVRSPLTDLYAVTDGRLTLGIVPSTSDSGMEVYRLLVCKKNHVYNHQIFANNSFCRPALLDKKGQEVVLFPNKLRRPFATKFKHYAAVGAGVTFAALGVVGGIKWFLHSSKYADEAIARSRDVEFFKEEQGRLSELISKHRDAITELTQKARERSLEVSKLQTEIDEALRTANPFTMNEVIKKVTEVDSRLGSELKLLFNLSEEIDGKLIKDLSEAVEHTDSIFAHKLRLLPTKDTFKLGDDGLAFYRGDYENHVGTYEEIIAKNFKDGNKVGEIPLDHLDQIVRSRNEAVELLQHAEQLHYLERSHTLRHKLADELFGIKFSDLGEVEKNNKIVGKIEEEYRLADKNLAELLEQHHDKYHMAGSEIKFIENLDVKYSNLSKSDFTDFLNEETGNAAFLKHAEAVAIEKKYFARLPVYNEIDLVFGYQKLLSKLKSSMSVSSSLQPLTDDSYDVVPKLLEAREAFIAAEASRKHTLERVGDAVKTSDFWKRMHSIKEDENQLIQEKIASLRKDIDSFEEKLRVGRFSRVSERYDIARGNEEIHKVKLERSGLRSELDALRQSLRAAEQGEFDEAERIRNNFAHNKSKWGIASLAGAGMLVALDRSIWGLGEKQIGNSWNQIFNKDNKFADATFVSDLPKILHNLAELFGHTVNTDALSL